MSRWQLLQRVNALNRRNSAACNTAVKERRGKDLDGLLTQGEKINRLFWRVYEQYVAERGALEI